MARTTPGVRLLPNAITVLALCSGLSAVQFALVGNYTLTIGAIGVAAVLDSLDGRIARLLDATSKIGAELDSLSDSISFGVAPAIVLYVWLADGGRLGWIAALVFAGCMVLRLARFNTLLDDEEQPPYASEFFVGVPAPAGGLLALLPLTLTVQFGPGWWSEQAVAWLWAVAIAALLISRVPTLSLKTFRVPAKAVAPLLVGVTLVAAAVIQYPLIALACALILYLVHIPFAVHRYHWLGKHPEVWDVPARERRAIRKRGRRRRLGLRPPLRRRVAGAARRAVRSHPDGWQGHAAEHTVNGAGAESDRAKADAVQPGTARTNGPPAGTDGRLPRRSWRRLGLRPRGGSDTRRH